MTVEKGEHGSNGMRNGLGQTIPLVQQNYIKEINGWYWRDVVIFNETLNNDVTVYWGYSKPHSVLGWPCLWSMLADGISYGRFSIYSCVNCAFSFVWPSTRFGLMTFIRRASGLGIDVLLVVDERNGKSEWHCSKLYGIWHRWSDREVVSSQNSRKCKTMKKWWKAIEERRKNVYIYIYIYKFNVTTLI